MMSELSVASLGIDIPLEFLKGTRFLLVSVRFGWMMLYAVELKETLALVLIEDGEVIAVTSVKLQELNVHQKVTMHAIVFLLQLSFFLIALSCIVFILKSPKTQNFLKA
jgi:hypothetical protein